MPGKAPAGPLVPLVSPDTFCIYSAIYPNYIVPTTLISICTSAASQPDEACPAQCSTPAFFYLRIDRISAQFMLLWERSGFECFATRSALFARHRQ